MKKILKLSLIAAAFAMVVPFVRAQEDDAAPKSSEKSEAKKPNDRERFTELLGLTKEQQSQVKELLSERKKAADEIKKDESMEKAEKAEKKLALYKEYRAKIRAILTPEQQAKLDACKEEFVTGEKPGKEKKKKKE